MHVLVSSVEAGALTCFGQVSAMCAGWLGRGLAETINSSSAEVPASRAFFTENASHVCLECKRATSLLVLHGRLGSKKKEGPGIWLARGCVIV